MQHDSPTCIVVCLACFQVRRDFKDIILQRELHDSVRALAAAAANTKRHGAPFRHMLFYGPPGAAASYVVFALIDCYGLRVRLA